MQPGHLIGAANQYLSQMVQGQAGVVGAGLVQQYPAEVRKPSLLGDSNRLIERLIEVSAKVERFADMLHGNAPTPFKNEAPQPAGAPVETNLQLNLDMAMNWVSRIEANLVRIQNGL